MHFLGGSDSKESAHNAGDLGSIPGLGRSPGKGNGTHSSITAWRIPWTEEPGGLQSMVSQSEMTERLILSHTHTHAYLYMCVHAQLLSHVRLFATP